ncbi:MAG: AMP-binding protein [Pseudomonadota bacterium]
MSADKKPWTVYYPANTRQDFSEPAYRTLGDLVRSASNTFEKSPAFTTCLANGMNGTLTFQQVDEMSDAFAVYLREIAGLVPGDRVAVQMPNCLSFPVVAFGIFKVGCVLVNVNPLYKAQEMSKQFNDAKPHALIIIDMFADKIPEATKGNPIPNIIVTRVAEFLPAMPRGIIGLVQKYWDRSVKPVTVPHLRLPDAIEKGRSELASKKIEVDSYFQALSPDDTACLQYTGGTTGVAKGAVLTHRNLIVNMEQTLEMLKGVEKGKEVALTALPLYHIFAFTVNMLGFYWIGARNILIPSPKPLSNLKRAFENYKITWMSGVNTLFNGLVNEVWFQDSPPKNLKFSCAGGMALQEAVAHKWEKITGKPVLQGYGLTETSPVLTFNPFGKTRDGSIGIPIPGTMVTCLGEDGQPVLPGESGEIAAKGPQVMKAYWNNEEETQKAMHDGYFLTGDIGTMDEDGYFRIVDRKKDMIIVSGFNIYPNEIEDCLAKHPGILESAVIGVPSEATGEAVKAFITKIDQGLTEEDVRIYCKEQLTAYKIPKIVEFKDDLPKSNVGKILRKDLRAEEIEKHVNTSNNIAET